MSHVNGVHSASFSTIVQGSQHPLNGCTCCYSYNHAAKLDLVIWLTTVQKSGNHHENLLIFVSPTKQNPVKVDLVPGIYRWLCAKTVDYDFGPMKVWRWPSKIKIMIPFSVQRAFRQGFTQVNLFPTDKLSNMTKGVLSTRNSSVISKKETSPVLIHIRLEQFASVSRTRRSHKTWWMATCGHRTLVLGSHKMHMVKLLKMSQDGSYEPVWEISRRGREGGRRLAWNIYLRWRMEWHSYAEERDWSCTCNLAVRR